MNRANIIDADQKPVKNWRITSNSDCIVDMAAKGLIHRWLSRTLCWLGVIYTTGSVLFLVFLGRPNLLEDMFPEKAMIRGIKLNQASTQTASASNLNKQMISSVCDMKTYLNRDFRACDNIVKNMSAMNKSMRMSRHTLSIIEERQQSVSFSSKPDRWCDIEKVSTSCREVRAAYLYGKHNIGVKERSFPLAFAIKLHANANQAHRLLRFIYRRHNMYCIHVDKKSSNDIYEQFVNISKFLDNIVVVEDRVSVVYSTIRQVDAEFRCIDAMLKSRVKWRYYINLTGQEFMLKTNAEIVEILELLNGRNDIESYPMLTDKHKYKQRTVVVGNRAHITKEKKAPFRRNILIRKGSAYGLFSRKFLEFIKNDTVANEFINWLEDTYAPEEMIWATLNAFDNAPGGYKRLVTQKNNQFLSRAVIWSLDKQFNCIGKYVRWVCIYGNGDLPWLLEHRNIVANKFHEDYQPLALNCLERSMYQRLYSRNGIGHEFDIKRYADVGG